MSEQPQLIGRIPQAMRKLARNARQQGAPNARVFVQNGLEFPASEQSEKLIAALGYRHRSY